MERLTNETVKSLMKAGITIVDTRPTEPFLEGLLDGAVFLPYDGGFVERIQQIVEDHQPLLIVADEDHIPELTKAIKLSGIGQIQGYFSGNFSSWNEVGLPTDILIAIEADEFAMDYHFDEFFLIDIRPAEAYALEHAEDSENIELSDLAQTLTDLDLSGSYYIYGNTATEAITAASLLKRNGFDRVRAVAADLESIKNSGVAWYQPKKKKESTTKKTSDN